MPLINGKRQYKYGGALIWAHTQDVEAQANAIRLQRALDEYGFKVTMANEVEWSLPAHDKMKCRAQALDKFDDWLEAETPAEDEEPEETLLAAYFVGHGHKDKRRHKKSQQEDHLILSWKSVEIDITDLQQTARDCFSSDIVFMTECCYAGHPGMDDTFPDDEHNWNRDGQKRMVTIGAGMGLISLVGDHPSDFAHRVAENLMSDKSARTCEERCDEMNRQGPNYDEIVHILVDGNEDIVFMPVLSKQLEWDDSLSSYF